MTDMASAAILQRQAGAARHAALLLLLVLLAGLGLTTFTRDWIAHLPSHDHLILNARALGVAHHAHDGDALSAALLARPTVDSAREAPDATAQLLTRMTQMTQADSGVISLRSLSGLQPELNSYTATGLATSLAPAFNGARGVVLSRERALPAGGELPAPLFPPPRPG